jgi:hypothetical protein
MRLSLVKGAVKVDASICESFAQNTQQTHTGKVVSAWFFHSRIYWAYFNNFFHCDLHKQKNKHRGFLVRRRTIPTDLPPLVGEF